MHAVVVPARAGVILDTVIKPDGYTGCSRESGGDPWRKKEGSANEELFPRERG